MKQLLFNIYVLNVRVCKSGINHLYFPGLVAAGCRLARPTAALQAVAAVHTSALYHHDITLSSYLLGHRLRQVLQLQESVLVEQPLLLQDLGLDGVQCGRLVTGLTGGNTGCC